MLLRRFDYPFLSVPLSLLLEELLKQFRPAFHHLGDNPVSLERGQSLTFKYGFLLWRSSDSFSELET